MKLIALSIFLALSYSITHARTALNATESVFFMLFTRANDIAGERIGFDVQTLRNSKWNSNNDVRILIHGHVGSYRVSENIVTTDEFLRKADFNVIAVDWSELASGEFDEVKLRIPDVGAVVGRFIDFLYVNGFTKFEKVNIVGHSFGSHVSGFAGKSAKYGKINAIFATDPAAGVGTLEDPSSRLDASDAEYVEAIMTSVIGLRQPVAHATFYPNWGLTQPGCNLDKYCDHHRATEFYTESVNSDAFVARKCESFEEIEAESCPGTGETALLGGDYRKNIRGIYFLETNAESPFARG